MSLQQGISGLNAASKNLEVIGNNVANANTFGAKSSRAEFADMYANAITGAGSANVGIGVTVASVAQQFNQGNVNATGNAMDLAINGTGFFQLDNGNGPVSYTRNGQFRVDRDGFVVNSQNQKLMGYPADTAGIIQPGGAKPLQLPTAGIKPTATDRIRIEMNLDARSGITVPVSGPPLNVTDPATYNNATSVTVYDAKGQDVALTYYFQKAGTDQWNVYITANGTPLAMDAAGNPAVSTSITFPSDGAAPTAPVGAVSIDVPASTNAAGAQTLAISGVQLNLSSASQYGSSFNVTDLTQNGYAPGQLLGIQFESNGVLMTRYSNGQSKPVGQVELASFRNPQGLQPIGGNGWASTFASGDPVMGVPSNGLMGALQAGALEESNVDLTAELVNMITAQRTYQANAQTIKTVDQVLQTLVNLR